MHKVRLDFKSPDIYHPDDFIFLLILVVAFHKSISFVNFVVSFMKIFMDGSENSNILYSE